MSSPDYTPPNGKEKGGRERFFNNTTAQDFYSKNLWDRPLRSGAMVEGGKTCWTKNEGYIGRKGNAMQTLIIGSSGGIGAALLARGGVGLSRSVDGFDITSEASVCHHLGALSGPFDRIIVATGALEIDGVRPEKSLKSLDSEAMLKQFALNAIGPALVLKHALHLMPRDRVAQFAVLSARVGSIGDNALGGWYGYRAAKAALNQLIHTASIEVVRSHPLAVVSLIHPGTVATSLTSAYSAGHPTVMPAVAAENILRVLDGVTQTGRFWDWQGIEIPW